MFNQTVVFLQNAILQLPHTFLGSAMAYFEYPSDRLAILDDLLEEIREAVGTSEKQHSGS